MKLKRWCKYLLLIKLKIVIEFYREEGERGKGNLV